MFVDGVCAYYHRGAVLVELDPTEPVTEVIDVHMYMKAYRLYNVPAVNGKPI